MSKKKASKSVKSAKKAGKPKSGKTSKKTKSEAKKKPLTGATAANFHEAGRSEYLAHYVFSSFGTSVPIPRQEDTGLDLICTLTERDGQRLWPKASYCVQVKSTPDPWVFDDERSVKWIIEHPLPVFLCVVNKKKAKLSVYHTSPRFAAWIAVPRPQRLVMVPGDAHDGYGMAWESEGYELGKNGEHPLSAPIAEFTLTEILDDAFHSTIKSILERWIQFDRENIFRIQAGLPLIVLNYRYWTNKTFETGSTRTWNTDVDAAQFEKIKGLLTEQLLWLGHYLYDQGDVQGHLRSTLLLQHFDALNGTIDVSYASEVYSQLRQHFEPDPKVHKKKVLAGLDGLSRKLNELTEPAIQEAAEKKKKDAEELAAAEANPAKPTTEAEGN